MFATQQSCWNKVVRSAEATVRHRHDFVYELLVLAVHKLLVLAAHKFLVLAVDKLLVYARSSRTFNLQMVHHCGSDG